jgi:hypothetical protein
MALAILRLDEDPDPGFGTGPPASVPTLVVDSGTSTHFRIHLGTEVRREDAFNLLVAPYWSSPLQVNPRAGLHVDTTTPFRLDPRVVTESGTLVQLETCRGPDGHGVTWSSPVRLTGFGVSARSSTGLVRRESTMSVPTTAARPPSLSAPRAVPCRSALETFSRPASIGDLISQVVRAAAPIVLGMLNQSSSSGTPAAPAAPGPAGAAPLLADILRSVLSALAHTPAAATATTPPAPAAVAPAAAPAPTSASAAPLVTAAPTSTAVRELNRFVPYERPMIFGIDDALIGALAGPVLSSVIGPVVQMLPQLLNATNQQKLARQALTDQQVRELLSEVDRSSLLQQVIAAQNQPVNPGTAAPPPPDPQLQALAALLQAQPTTAAPVGTAAAPPAAGAAVSRATSVDPSLPAAPIASRAVLSMVVGPAITRLGRPQVVFSH